MYFRLTAAELAVLRLLCTHLTTVEMARHLCVSTNTVKTHKKAIYLKLGARSRSEAVGLAADLGLVSVSVR